METVRTSRPPTPHHLLHSWIPPISRSPPGQIILICQQGVVVSPDQSTCPSRRRNIIVFFFAGKTFFPLGPIRAYDTHAQLWVQRVLHSLKNSGVRLCVDPESSVPRFPLLVLLEPDFVAILFGSFFFLGKGRFLLGCASWSERPS